MEFEVSDTVFWCLTPEVVEQQFGCQTPLRGV